MGRLEIAASRDKGGNGKTQNNINESGKSVRIYLRGVCAATLTFAWMTVCASVQEVRDGRKFC